MTSRPLSRASSFHEAFGPVVKEDSMSNAQSAIMEQKLKLEQENQQLFREVLSSRKNLDIAQQNVSTLKALCNQLAQQLNSANNEISILREKRNAGDLLNARETENKVAEVRKSYESRLEEMRKELEEQIEINTQLATESQDAHRKADKSFKDIIATKDGLIAELTRTVECLQAGLKNHHQNHKSHNTSSNHNNASITRLSSPSRSSRAAHPSSSSSYDAISVRNQIIEPTIDLLRLSLRTMKEDISKRHTPLGEVNSMYYSSEKKPTTRYFVDVHADKHRLDEVPTVELIASGEGSGRHFSSPRTPQWPRVWKFHTPQGELITLTLNVDSL